MTAVDTAVREAGREVFAAHVSYSRTDGSPETDVPYWGGMTLLPHMLKLLSQPRVKVRVNLRAVTELPDCRKELAQQLQQEVARLRPA